MRALTLTACVVLLAAADGSALAQSCGKGMLWPYVRQPGDCLTDDEIRAGQRGVYNGPINTNPDLSNVRVETPPATTAITGSSGPAPAAAGSGSSGAAPAAAASGALFGGGVMEQNSSGAPLNGPGFTSRPVQNAAPAPCAKGWLWPFVRNPGDCLTDVEKQSGQAGVYRADQVVASTAPAAGPGVTQVSAPGPAGAATPAGGVETPPANAEPACRKGWLWPFVRKPGDCPTDAERGQRR